MSLFDELYNIELAEQLETYLLLLKHSKKVAKSRTYYANKRKAAYGQHKTKGQTR